MNKSAGTDAATSAPAGEHRPRRWRFGLRSLFLAMAGVAIALVLAKWWGLACFFIVAMFAAPIVFCRRGRSRELRAMKSSIVYLALSIITLPALDSIWLGELPVLAILQLPKTEFARSMRWMMVYYVMGPLGLSRGSFSPDWSAAGPYALALAYAIPIGILLAIVTWRTRMAAPYRYWAIALVILAVIDYLMMRAYASGPGLTIY
jgi:hypothetical protein